MEYIDPYAKTKTVLCEEKKEPETKKPELEGK